MSTISQLAREGRAKQLTLRTTLIAGIVLVLVGLLAGRPLYRRWLSIESEKHLAHAREAIARQDWTQALLAVQNAARSAPQNPEMLRTGVIVLAEMQAHPDEILRTIKEVEAAGGMTPEMFIKRAQAHLTRGDYVAADQALHAVPDAQRQSWEAVELESTLLLFQGRQTEADAVLSSQPDTKSDTPDAAFRLAVITMALPREPQRSHAREIVWQTARGNTANTPVALALLCRNPDLTSTEAIELLDLAERQKGPFATGLRYAVLANVLRLAPGQKMQLLKAESDRAAAAMAKEQVGYLMFLLKNRESQAMLDFLETHGSILKHERPADYLGMELEALAQSQEWSTVRKKLAAPEARILDGVMLDLWQACSLAAFDPTSPAKLEHLKLAREATRRTRNIAGAIRVADTAANIGPPDFAAACYEELAAGPALPSDTIVLLEKACLALAQAHDTAGLVRVTRALADQTPGHLENAFRCDYLAILTGAPLDGIVMRLAEEDEQRAADPQIKTRHRFLRAMVLDRHKQFESLRTELRDLESAGSWTPGERSVMAGMLAASGDTARAWRLAEKVPAALLLKEEAAMLARVR
jgi:hypothetical protein